MDSVIVACSKCGFGGNSCILLADVSLGGSTSRAVYPRIHGESFCVTVPLGS